VSGGLVPAPFGLREPAPPWRPPVAIGAASVVLVPALAVDRRGNRLGRGAGFYDRALPLADPAARLIAVVRDDELIDEIPAEPHDIAMTHVLTPGWGVIPLG
jgi:5-formyltetrahydrofolate cyclo-ligase